MIGRPFPRTTKEEAKAGMLGIATGGRPQLNRRKSWKPHELLSVLDSSSSARWNCLRKIDSIENLHRFKPRIGPCFQREHPCKIDPRPHSSRGQLRFHNRTLAFDRRQTLSRAFQLQNLRSTHRRFLNHPPLCHYIDHHQRYLHSHAYGRHRHHCHHRHHARSRGRFRYQPTRQPQSPRRTTTRCHLPCDPGLRRSPANNKRLARYVRCT